MKKVLVLLMVAFATSAFAVNPTNYKVVYKLNNETTFKSLARYLEVNDSQADQLKNVFKVTENEMQTALSFNNMLLADNVLLYNVKNTKYILSDEQYKKYLSILNLSVNNESEELLSQK